MSWSSPNTDLVTNFITLENQSFQNFEFFDSRTPRTSGPLGSPRSLGSPGPTEPQETRDPGTPWTLGPHDPWKIPSTIWTSEPKHPETLKLKHKQKTSLNYITQQSQTKAGKCVYLSEVLLEANLPFASLQPRHYYQEKWQTKTSDWIYLDWKR